MAEKKPVRFYINSNHEEEDDASLGKKDPHF